MIRVLVADDHPLFREGIASLLKRTPDIELVGEVATGEQATLLAKDLLPDDESVFAAVRAGGRGYVLKDADPEGLLRAIRAVAEGEVPVGRGGCIGRASAVRGGPARQRRGRTARTTGARGWTR